MTLTQGTSENESGVALPDAAPGLRAQRRKQKRTARRQRVVRFFAGLAALGLVGVGVTALLGRSDARRKPSAPPVDQPIAHPPRVLVAHRAPDGTAQSLAVFAPAEGPKAGTIVLIPPGTMAEMASLGLEPIGESLDLGGPGRLLATLENMLGVDLDETVVLDDSDLVALAKPLEPLAIEIASRVETVAADGTVEVLYEPGVVEVRASEVPSLLTIGGRDAGLNLLTRHQAFWQEVIKRLGERDAEPVPAPRALRRALEGLAAGRSVRVRVLPVESLGHDPDKGFELYKLKTEELGRFVASSFAGEPVVTKPRPRIQILNGTGELEIAPRVADLLVPAGMQVTLTGNAARFDHKVTQIVFYDRSKQEIAERVKRALGVGRVVLSRQPLGVVDVTVVVGRDFTSSDRAESDRGR